MGKRTAEDVLCEIIENWEAWKEAEAAAEAEPHATELRLAAEKRGTAFHRLLQVELPMWKSWNAGRFAPKQTGRA